MDLATSTALRAYAAGRVPEKFLSPSQWSDAYRMLGSRASSEPGPWRTSRTPYLEEILDSLGTGDPADIVVLQKGAQLGATEAGNNWTGYIIDHAPGPMLYVQPTVDLARRLSKQRIAPMLLETPRLAGLVKDNRSRDSGNTMLVKEFPHGILVITGANSAVGLRSMPARFLFCDEIDAYPADVDGEGDPLELTLARTRTFRRNRKAYLTSTPTIKGMSRIESWFERGDRRRYFVACPNCGAYDWIRWSRIAWDKSEDGEHLPDTVRLVCEDCGADIRERHKPELLATGEWQATAKPQDRRIRSFHISALYSPLGWYSWADAVRDFLKAKADGPEALKAWVNTVLGETWEDEGQDLDHGVLYQRREEYGTELPAQVCLLTAGVDIQADRIELEILGWDPLEESFGIRYDILHGDPDGVEVWEQLDVVLAETFQHPGGAKLAIAMTCIDAGYKTTHVWNFVKRHPGGRMYPVQGAPGMGRPMVSAPSQKRSGKNRRPVRQFTLGVDQIKSLVYSRFRITEEGAGYCHFPQGRGYDEEVFAQLTAERCVTRVKRGVRFYEWVKKRPRNEALDCRVYNTAALLILGEPALRAAAKRLAARRGKRVDELTPTRRRRKRNWVNSWKK